nr:MAG TPA: hypothetical protein [Caudoviricetes sp.]
MSGPCVPGRKRNSPLPTASLRARSYLRRNSTFCRVAAKKNSIKAYAGDRSDHLALRDGRCLRMGLYAPVSIAGNAQFFSHFHLCQSGELPCHFG